jgi:hypothetical protein
MWLWEAGSNMFEGNPITEMAAGQWFSLALAGGQVHTDAAVSAPSPRPQQVYSWGNGGEGQLGLEMPPDDPNRPKFIPLRFHVFAPQLIENLRSFLLPLALSPFHLLSLGSPTVGLRSVRSIAVGSAFSMALCEDGSVYSWGKNDIGQLGHGDQKGRPSPTKVVRINPPPTLFLQLAMLDRGSLRAGGQDHRRR